MYANKYLTKYYKQYWSDTLFGDLLWTRNILNKIKVFLKNPHYEHAKFSLTERDMECTYNLTQRCFRTIVVAVENQ